MDPLKSFSSLSRSLSFRFYKPKVALRYVLDLILRGGDPVFTVSSQMPKIFKDFKALRGFKT